MVDHSSGRTRPGPDVAGASRETDARERVLRRLDRLATLLDASIPVPFARTRIGLDGLLGLIPGFGDAAAGVLSLYIVAEAWRLGAPMATIVHMIGNVAADTLVGTVPLAGDLFDFAYKANRRNVALLRQALRTGDDGDRAHRGTP